VETRVQIPLGLRGNAQVRGHVRCPGAEPVRSRPAFVPRPLRTRRHIWTQSTVGQASPRRIELV
jgi:hypothetical protein